MASFAKGDFFAWCEGDDFWCATDKLALQVQTLTENKNINLCIHDAFVIDNANSTSRYRFPKRENRPQLLEYINLYKTANQFSPTASMLVRAKVLENIPDFVHSAPVGDFFIEALAGRNGVFYLPNKMSVYRRATEGAWSSHILKNIERNIGFNLKMLDSLLKLKIYLGIPESKYVKYKTQAVCFSLSNLYIGNHDFYNAVKYQVKSLRGQLFIRRQLSLSRKLMRNLFTRKK